MSLFPEILPPYPLEVLRAINYHGPLYQVKCCARDFQISFSMWPIPQIRSYLLFHAANWWFVSGATMIFQKSAFFTLKIRRYAKFRSGHLAAALLADKFHPYFKNIVGNLKGWKAAIKVFYSLFPFFCFYLTINFVILFLMKR